MPRSLQLKPRFHHPDGIGDHSHNGPRLGSRKEVQRRAKNIAMELTPIMLLEVTVEKEIETPRQAGAENGGQHTSVEAAKALHTTDGEKSMESVAVGGHKGTGAVVDLEASAHNVEGMERNDCGEACHTARHRALPLPILPLEMHTLH